MNQIEIPIATPIGKVFILGYCSVVGIAIVYWGIPGFKVFLTAVFERSICPVRRILGFAVYAFVFAPAVIAAYCGLAIVTTPPTVISSQGVTGGQFACYRSIGVVAPTCTFPLKAWITSRNAILWEEIENVRCMSSQDGSVRGFRIDAGNRRIEVGNLGNLDLGTALAVLEARAPKGTVQPCETPWDK
jgi:hypothetical protein